MRTIYLRPRMVRQLPRACCVVNVSPLLQQLIVHLCTVGKLSRRSKTHAHLIDVLIDQLETVQAVPLQLPSPSDPRRPASRLRCKETADKSRSLAWACKQAGASKRTIERLFQQETRMSLGKWQTTDAPDAISATCWPPERRSASAALEAGYSTPSAFIAMFRKALGTTPRRYFENGSARS